MKFLAEDNDSFNDKKHILALGRDSPITAYCGGEFGINAQYPPPQTEPTARVKTANLSIKDTQQDLTGGINKFRLQGNASFQLQVFIQLYQGMGCSQHLSNYSLLMCESLYLDFRYQLEFFKYKARLRSWDLWVMGSPKPIKIK